jgi:hypothetical protein
LASSFLETKPKHILKHPEQHFDSLFMKKNECGKRQRVALYQDDLYY